MSLIEIIEFVFRFSLGAFDPVCWIGVVITLIVFAAIGSLWGRAWNRSWKLSLHGGFMALIALFAILSGYAAFNLRTIDILEDWFAQQKTTLPRAISDSSRLKRNVIVESWSRLEPKQGQEGLEPPDQSGDQVRLNTPEEAYLLASVAAEEARSALRLKPPFTMGAILITKSPEEVATDTMDALKIDPSAYPKTVSSQNEWTATAATIQTNYALDAAHNQIRTKLGDLKSACQWLLGICLLLTLTYTAIRAVEDIKVNPKV